ncbi:intradiol ring-cleavage dioxygenase [Streptomyces misionensis]|uniref:intradiol ring-cleavage dioxygenase n=1 Tax=Streptomyces misionensis TaxID=67331 RepID=UPI0033EF14A4
MTDGDNLRARRERAVTDEVLASFSDAESPRLKELMAALVEHLHAFAREVRLTETEWDLAINYLTEAGQISTDRRQEFILLSDVLGLSMLTVGINAPAVHGATESTVFGPFFMQGSPQIERGGNIAEGVKGQPCYIHGVVRDVDGAPVPSARIEVWEADDDGFYDVQYEGDKVQGRGHLFSGPDGEYDFWCVLPAPYPIPHDGPVGRLLAASNRSPMRPAHVHFMVTAPGYSSLITHIFVEGSDHLDGDAVFGVKPSLIIEFKERVGFPAPGAHVDGPWVEAEFDIVLSRSGESSR